MKENNQKKKPGRIKRITKISKHSQAPILSLSTTSLPAPVLPPKTAPLQEKVETKLNQVQEIADDTSSSFVSQQIETKSKGDFIETPKSHTKKKVLFDLESLSSFDASGDRLKENVPIRPVYIDELKQAVKLRAKESDTSLESSILDDIDIKNGKVLKDIDVSDWDVSDILQ